MDAFTVAAGMLGGLELGSSQLAQLRAINSKYYQRLYTLLHASDTPGRLGGSYAAPDPHPVERALTPAELTDLHAMLVSDIRGMLSPGQRTLLDRPDGRARLAEDDVPAREPGGDGPG